MPIIVSKKNEMHGLIVWQHQEKYEERKKIT